MIPVLPFCLHMREHWLAPGQGDKTKRKGMPDSGDRARRRTEVGRFRSPGPHPGAQPNSCPRAGLLARRRSSLSAFPGKNGPVACMDGVVRLTAAGAAPEWSERNNSPRSPDFPFSASAKADRAPGGSRARGYGETGNDGKSS